MKKKKTRTESLEIFQTIYNYRFYYALIIVLIVAFYGSYVRMLPALNHGFELHANDPWIEYWLTDYLNKHGILSWYDLTRDNPDTHIFWYPLGRDFTHTEYPLAPMIGAITYKFASLFGLTLKEWAVMLPVVAGFAMIIIGYFLARELGGEIPGIVAAFFLAFTPGALDRTIAGFIEKEGFSMPFILLTLLFFVKLVKKPNMKMAVLTGFFGGLVGWSWGGYQAIMMFVVAPLLLMPIFRETKLYELKMYTLTFAIWSLMLIASPTVGLNYSIKGAIPLFVATIVLQAFSYGLYAEKLRILGRISAPKIYALVLILLIAVGFGLIYTEVLFISKRVLFFLGKQPESPLVASVSEHQILPIRFTMSQTGGPFLLSIPFITYSFIRARKKPELLAIAVPGLMMLYLAFRSAYLIQTVTTILSITGALTASFMAKYLSSGLGITGRKDSLTATLSVIGLAIISILIVAHGSTGISIAASTIPSIKAGGVNIATENNAWIYALDYIKEHTDKNALIISWWDYGYWISVYTGRSTVADGATLNSTQIKLLAKALTATDEKESVDIIFNKFKAPKNDTYLLIFDVFRSIKTSGDFWFTGPLVSPFSGTAGLGDIPKSIWMLRIGERLGLNDFSPYFVPRQIQITPTQQAVVTTPNWTNPLVMRTLIYKLFINGVNSMGTTVMGGCSNFTGAHMFVDWTQFYGTNITTVVPQPTQHFIPYKTIVDCIYDTDSEKVFVAIFLFKVKE